MRFFRAFLPVQWHYYTLTCGNLQIFFERGMLMFHPIQHLRSIGKSCRWNARSLTYAAMAIALSCILSYIRLYRFSFGGSITLCSMLPVMLCAVAQGPARGVIIGCAYGLLQLIQDFYVAHPVQLLLDYPLAFAMLGLAGLVNYIPLPDRAKLPAAVLIASCGRFVMHLISGAVFFGSYAAPGQTAIAYSFLYNIGYMGPDAAFCLIAACLPAVGRLAKHFPR